MNARRELAALLGFVRSPRRRPRGDATSSGRWPRFLLIWLSSVAFAALLTSLIFWALSGIEDALNPDAVPAPEAEAEADAEADPDDHALTPVPGRLRHALDVPYLFEPGMQFLIIVVGPVVEELVFRSGLRKPWFAFSLGAAAAVTAAVLWLPVGSGASIASVAVAGLLGLGAWWFASHSKRLGGAYPFARGYVRYFPRVIWVFAALFALVHVGNFHGDASRSLWVLPLVLPQFCLGLVLSYVRLRDGLVNSILLHALFNATFMLALRFGYGE